VRVTEELRDLEARYGLILVVGEEHDPRAKERLSASGLSRQIPDIAERDVVVAGPRQFKRYVGGALSRLAVPRSQIHFKSGQKV
jgi:ferredoxin-NADP reductase